MRLRRMLSRLADECRELGNGLAVGVEAFLDRFR